MRPGKTPKDDIKMDVWKVGCEDERWIELAEDRVQWQAFVSAVLDFRLLLLNSNLSGIFDQARKWIELAEDRSQWQAFVSAVLDLGFCCQIVTSQAFLTRLDLKPFSRFYVSEGLRCKIARTSGLVL
jgi:hypothetical protein